MIFYNHPLLADQMLVSWIAIEIVHSADGFFFFFFFLFNLLCTHFLKNQRQFCHVLLVSQKRTSLHCAGGDRVLVRKRLNCALDLRPLRNDCFFILILIFLILIFFWNAAEWLIWDGMHTEAPLAVPTSEQIRRHWLNDFTGNWYNLHTDWNNSSEFDIQILSFRSSDCARCLRKRELISGKGRNKMSERRYDYPLSSEKETMLSFWGGRIEHWQCSLIDSIIFEQLLWLVGGRFGTC